MIADAELFREADENAKAIVDARNNLEGMIYQMKTSLSDDNMSSIPDDMKTELTAIIDEKVSWLEANQMATKEDYEAQANELNEKMKPLQEKIMAGMPTAPDVPAGENHHSVNIDEVD